MRKTTQKQVSHMAKEVRAEAFILVDSQGRERARLKTVDMGGRIDTVLAFHDEEGRTRLTLRDSWEEATLNFFSQINGVTERVMTVGYQGTTDGGLQPGVTICDGAGATRILLKINEESNGELFLLGANDTQTGISADGMTTWNANDRIVAEVGIFEPDEVVASAPTPAAGYIDKTAALVPEVEDVQAEMQAAIDGLLMIATSNSTDSEIATELMLFLYRVSRQSNPTMGDCLDWAVTRCFQWTKEHEDSRAAYIAGFLQQGADIAAGKELTE